MDLGASRRGVDMGPSALRIADLDRQLIALGYGVEDHGNLPAKDRDSLAEPGAGPRYVEEIARVLSDLKDEVHGILARGRFPVVLGGDHSIALGTVAGVSKFYRAKGQQIGLIWFDAHGDVNTPETSPSGNVHGMPVAHMLGLGDRRLLALADALPLVEAGRIMMIGLRDLDPGERKLIRELGIMAFTMRDVDGRGLPQVVAEAIRIASNGSAGFHVSFDMDCLDPSVAPGVGTPVPGGMTYREAHLAMEMIAESQRMLSIEVTEVNPVLDIANQTGKLATGLILTALGERLL